jgi:hypothetical protein
LVTEERILSPSRLTSERRHLHRLLQQDRWRPFKDVRAPIGEAHDAVTVTLAEMDRYGIDVALVSLTHPENPIGISLGRIVRELTKVLFRDYVWPRFLRENSMRAFRLDEDLWPAVSPDASAAAPPV